MWRVWLLISLCAVTACTKAEKAGPAPASSRPEVASGAPTGPADAAALSFVPAEIAGRLGDANTLIAIDLARLGVDKLALAFGRELPCAGEMLATAGIAVVGEGEGYVTGLREADTLRCLGKIVPTFGGKLDGKRLVIGTMRYSLVWNGGVLHVAQVGGAARKPLSDRQRARVASIPATAAAWVVSNGYENYKIAEARLWLEPGGTHWRITLLAEGTEPGSARPWAASVIDGLTQGFASKGVAVDEQWFELTSTDMNAHLVATFPTSIFEQLAQ